MNKKSLIFSGIVAALSLVTIILLFVPMISGAAFQMEGTYSVYSFGTTLQGLLAEMGGEMGEAASILQTIALVIVTANMLVLATNIVIFVFAVLSILTACNIIRSPKAAKAFGIIAVVFGSFGILFALVLALVYIMMTMQVAIEYAVVVFPVLAIVLIVLASINLHVVKKAAKQAAMFGQA